MNEFTCSEHSLRIRRSKKRSTGNQALNRFSTKWLFSREIFFCLMSSRLEIIINLFNFDNSMSLRAKKNRLVENRLHAMGFAFAFRRVYMHAIWFAQFRFPISYNLAECDIHTKVKKMRLWEKIALYFSGQNLLITMHQSKKLRLWLTFIAASISF